MKPDCLEWPGGLEGSTGSRKCYSGPECEICGAVVVFLSLETPPCPAASLQNTWLELRSGKGYRTPFLFLPLSGARGLAWPLWLCCQEAEKARKGERQRTNSSVCSPPCKAYKDEAIQGLLPFFSPTAIACLMWRPPTSQKDREKDKAGLGHLSYCPLRPCGWLLVGTGPSFRDNGTIPKQRQAGERPRLRGLNTPNSNSSFFYMLCRTQRCFSLCQPKFFIH